MSEPSHPRPTKQRWVLTLAVLFGLFILWPLSMGPFVWLVWHDWISIDTAVQINDTVYQPWNWLCENNTAVAAFFDWYLALWVPNAYAP